VSLRHSLKIKSHKRSHKTVEIKDPDPYVWLTVWKEQCYCVTWKRPKCDVVQSKFPSLLQCSGFIGSVCLWASYILISNFFYTTPDISINPQKNLEKPWFCWVLSDFLMTFIFEDWCKCKKQNKLEKKVFWGHFWSHWRKEQDPELDPDPEQWLHLK
jgi:hypothetical protein